MSLFAFGTLNYVILAVYLVAMFAIGLSFAGRQKTTEDYFLAGRQMPWWVVGISMFASLTSAASYMGIPGYGHDNDIAWIALGPVSVLMAPFLAWFFYPFYRGLGVTTSYEYIALRFGGLARSAVSGLFLLARLGWLGVVIYAPALALSIVTGMNLYVSIVLMAVLATSYTALGGLSAVLWTDVLQFVILVGGAIWIAVTLVMRVPDGLAGIHAAALEAGHYDALSWNVSLFELTLPVVAFSFIWMLMQDYGTDQVTVQRLLAVRRDSGVAKAILFNGFTDLIMMSLLLFIGVGMYAYYLHFPDPGIAELKAKAGSDIVGDKMLPYYIVNALPNGISGLLISGIFAAAMSSMDSGINSVSTVIVNDFIKPWRRWRGREEAKDTDVTLARVLTVVLGLFAMTAAFIVALTKTKILAASSTILGLFAGPILALFLLGMLSRRGSFFGWLIGMPLGIGAGVWLSMDKFGPDNDLKVHFLWIFPICFGVTIIVSYLASFFFDSTPTDPKFTIWGRSRPVEE
tara:strand:+ start:1307 stop:2857 length:1551 start_codon:yes stop_codon:yes gene_type:complete